ncbi:MAG TPA: DUF1579 family protein [Terriglobales bacterium]|nr:DUF1579 family protein [Terriglobales bacterium]
MKRVAFAVGLVVLVFSVSIWAQTQAPTPGPELKKFEVFLGHWTYTGEYKAGPLGPASKVAGEWSSRKILGGFFIQNQWAEKGPTGESRGIEIVQYDPVAKSIYSTEYHSDGSSASGVYTFNGNVCTYSGKFLADLKQIMVRMTGTFSADSMGFTAKGEASTDGKTWTPWYEGQYTKTKPAPKK